MSEQQKEQWHLDKRVPLALIAAIFGQSAGLLIWGSNLHTRVNQIESQLSASAPQAERIIRLETKMDSIFGSLAEIKLMIQQRPPR